MAEAEATPPNPEFQQPNGLTIVVSGGPGVGSTSLAKELAQTFAIPCVSVGAFVRRWMTRQNAAATISDEAGLLAFQSQHNDAATMHPDRVVARLNRLKPALVIDSHLYRLVQHRFPQPNFHPFSLGIYLHCHPRVAAARIHCRQIEAGEPHLLTVDELVEKNFKRMADNVHRFNRAYGLAIPPAENYSSTVTFFSAHNDIVIDTTPLTLEQVCHTALHDIENLAAENQVLSVALAAFTHFNQK